MRLENIVFDARDPRRLGRFWAAALGARPTIDGPDYVEARLPLADDVFLDLCFPQVAAPSDVPPRLHLDLRGGDGAVDRLLGLGATHADIGQGDVPWTVLADPEGSPFCVLDADPGPGTGPIAALPLDSADPDRDAALWAAATGWTRRGTALSHPSGVGPRLELCPEPAPWIGKGRLHLDVRPGVADGDAVARLVDLGARPISTPDEHPWRVCADASGNVFCVLLA